MDSLILTVLVVKTHASRVCPVVFPVEVLDRAFDVDDTCGTDNCSVV